MARPKEFDRDQALVAAMRVFWLQGYEPTTTDQLRRAMGIGRQSFYDTFGDKQRCFVEALELYGREVGVRVNAPLVEARSALKGIEKVLMAIPTAKTKDKDYPGCLIVNTCAEQIAADPSVSAALRALNAQSQAHLEAAVRRAREAGELSEEVEPRAAAHFLHTTLQGLRLAAKAGATTAQLTHTAKLALRALR